MTSKAPTNKPDWNILKPIKQRIADLMADGKPRSVLCVCQTLNLASNPNARNALATLEREGVLTSEYAKVTRHAVIVYVAARTGATRKRVSRLGG